MPRLISTPPSTTIPTSMPGCHGWLARPLTFTASAALIPPPMHWNLGLLSRLQLCSAGICSPAHALSLPAQLSHSPKPPFGSTPVCPAPLVLHSARAASSTIRHTSVHAHVLSRHSRPAGLFPRNTQPFMFVPQLASGAPRQACSQLHTRPHSYTDTLSTSPSAHPPQMHACIVIIRSSNAPLSYAFPCLLCSPLMLPTTTTTRLVPRCTVRVMQVHVQFLC